MEDQPKRPRRQQARRVGAHAIKTSAGAAAPSLSHIAELIDDGQITVGVMEPVGCVAVASEDHCNLAMLRRRKGETLLELLTRLDQAIDKAETLGIFTDEINR
jgi:hypothetical protein